MAKVIMESWREGLKKVSLTKLQNELLGPGLKESKCNVDLLLADKEIIFEIDDIELAKKFLEKAEKIGINCKMLT